MSRALLLVGVIKEWIDVERVFPSAHVGQGRLRVGLVGRAPDEETGVVIVKIIQVGSIVESLYVGIPIGQVATQPDTAVVVVDPVAVVDEGISRQAQVQILDSPPCRLTRVCGSKEGRLVRIWISPFRADEP